MVDFVTVIDCETTGIDDEARVVEVAAVRYDFDFGSSSNGQIFQTLINPGVPIPATASAIHHIVDEMCADAPDLDAALSWLRSSEPMVWIAHNAKFDRRFLGPLGDRWVCTYKCALQQWPDAPSHSNQVLSYWLKAPRPPESTGHTHRALFDAWTTVGILDALKREGWTLERMLEVSGKPALLPRFRFGKHANVPLSQVPGDYLQWMLRQDFDEDVMFTADSELQRRRS
jgi:exodeoxyribonuclease X